MLALLFRGRTKRVDQRLFLAEPPPLSASPHPKSSLSTVEGVGWPTCVWRP